MNPFSISNLTQRSNAHILHNHLKGKKKSLQQLYFLLLGRGDNFWWTEREEMGSLNSLKELKWRHHY